MSTQLISTTGSFNNKTAAVRAKALDDKFSNSDVVAKKVDSFTLNSLSNSGLQVSSSFKKVNDVANNQLNNILDSLDSKKQLAETLKASGAELEMAPKVSPEVKMNMGITPKKSLTMKKKMTMKR